MKLPSSACLITPSLYRWSHSWRYASFSSCICCCFFAESILKASYSASLFAISFCFFSSSYLSAMRWAFVFRLTAVAFIRWPLIPFDTIVKRIRMLIMIDDLPLMLFDCL